MQEFICDDQYVKVIILKGNGMDSFKQRLDVEGNFNPVSTIDLVEDVFYQ
jgi:hypothetical protein